MADELTLYTNPMSRGQIARWMVHETGLPHGVVVLDYGTTMKAPDYLAINPMGKVPAIVHNGQVVTECAAICAYLADAVPERELAPPPADRGDYYRWLLFAAGPLEQAVITRALGMEVPEDKEAMAGFGSYDRAVAALESWLKDHDYVAAGRFTAADVYVGAQVIWGTQFGTLPKLPAFEGYAARLLEREAYRSAKAIDDALIAEMRAAAPA
ncbi:glutathione S-transferase [Sphingomonas spermidinifaciens]|uniref:Glutathione S-transferase n=1 Tax=Sphingomonas spermidinifaciens TaxID=1141889 RepID=A0A2A4B5A3_9SPHN|nr:glutathione S-transferase family protein [Sphingomonas spermidinifaciens]PCD03247.1 glutathione S-transferase [Sphingomonas spermidinifaciens]